MKMAEFDYQWKHTLDKDDLKNEEDKFECNEKRIKEFLEQFKNKNWFFKNHHLKEKFVLMQVVGQVDGHVHCKN